MGGKCGDWEDFWNWGDIDFGHHPNDVKPDYKPPTPPKPGAHRGKVLQISDFHLDVSYQIGADSDCGLPLCCMNTTPMARDPAKAAGDWGSYTCDLTVWTAEDMLLHIVEEHSDEVIYFHIELHFTSKKE